MVEYQSVNYPATDGYSIRGRFYAATKAKGTIIIASATGVPQRFYQRFAMQAIEHDFNVVTFDYRGVGESAPASLKQFKMDYRDWADKDLEGVINRVSEQPLPIFVLGHSYGGQALGLLNNHHKVTAAYAFGTGAGWYGWMPMLERLKVSFMWNIVAPVLTRYKGYLGWSALGMGEDLPMDVYKQWKRWCSFPHYFFDDPKYPEMHEKFAQVSMPLKAVNAIDDKWALPKSRDIFMAHYKNATLHTKDIDPKEYGLKELGHMGYFFSTASGLWDDVFSFFTVQMQKTAD